jgi:hypothetical protein
MTLYQLDINPQFTDTERSPKPPTECNSMFPRFLLDLGAVFAVFDEFSEPGTVILMPDFDQARVLVQ